MADSIKLRELTNEDQNKLFEIYSDKEAMKYRGSKPMENIADARLFVNNQKLLKGNMLTLRQGIEIIKNGELIGSTMCRFDKRKIGECEIGYSIGRKFWRKGFGKEVLKTLLKSISKNAAIKNVIAWSHKENIASIKILEFNGFRRVEQNEKQDIYLYRKILVPFKN